MSGSSAHCRGFNPVLIVAAIFTAIILLTGPVLTAQAEISWRSGVEMGAGPSGEDARLALSELSKKGSGQHIVVQFSKPVTFEQRAALEDLGVGLQSYLGSNAYFAVLKTGGLEITDLRSVPTLTSAMAIELEWKLAPAIVAGEYPDYAFTVDTDTMQPRVAAYVMFHRDVPLGEGQQLALRHGAEVVAEVFSINMLVVEMPLEALLELAGEDAVMWVEPPLPYFSELNNSNSVITQANTAQTSPYNLDGSGVGVLVYDGGYALQSHGDFSGRLTVRDSSGLSDHATHVCGTIGGDGSGNSTYEGMAPNVTIQSYGFEYDGSGTFLYTNPGDLESDYNQAINTYGVDISNNSIGSNVEPNYFDCSYQGDYGATAALIDEVVGGSLGTPFRVVWAAGNERQGSRCDVEGYGDYYSTAPPGCAKNQISVGALNSNNDSMTSFSSWGPTDDGRLKPDISGPGCQSNDDGGVTSCSSSGGYTVKCGTSMSSPTVTGLLSLLLEDFRVQFPAQDDPRNSTLKILLAHNAVDLGNTGPDYQSGFGSVRIADTIDFMRGGEFEENQVSQGGSVNYQVDVPGGTSELKITLAWDDVAGTPNVNPNLVNDLDLVVMSPSSSRAYPWTLNPTSPSSSAVRTQADHTNNIEQVLVDSPEAGTWTITVQGYNVPDGPQSYSICGSPGIGVSGPADCNNNGIPDDEDISGGTSQDCDGNGVPDECQTDSDGDGVIDPCDGCPGDPNKITPGICGCGVADIDSDGDGTLDCNDGCPSDPNKIDPGDCGCGEPDIDSDGDGTADCIDGCPDDPNKTDPGDCGCGLPDIDSDGDGTADCIDGCPNDPDKIDPGLCGCGVPDEQILFADDFETDQGWTAVNLGATSGDWQRGVPVDDDAWDYDPASDSDGSGQCYLTQNELGNTDVDNGAVQLISPIFDLAAGDVTISYDYFLRLTNEDGSDRLLVEIDSNGGAGPWTEIARHDTDGGLSWRSHTITQADLDTAGVTMTSNMQMRFTTNDADTQSINESGLDAFLITGTGCGGITDCNNNGIPDDEDISGGTSQDCDGNGVPDECQTDSDGDGVIDPCDGCPADPNKTEPGDCGCGTPDTDSDGDGTPDCNDGCPNDPNKIAPGICGCGVLDIDSDGDGYLDCVDNCPDNYNPGQEDCDSDGVGDICAGEPDCNLNDIPDSCDISSGTSEDLNGNGIPDECETGNDTLSVDFTCTPSVGTVPFATSMQVTLTNNYTGLQRRFAARVNVQLADGRTIPSWRAGFTNVAAGDSYITNWMSNIPNLGSVIGDNIFTLEAEDVTPAPYNQPPYPPSGDMESDACTVTAVAP